ncbi:DNA-binding protein [Streptomyces scabiei]|uniref:DNA-binding protein n=1 Tax=Streptomyces scabiei TaxID=1930 RepID=UPI00299021F1|nr:DNA-binding protein [Streptomyces scabiei]MDW8807420.1 DNA-binding protein [Streptomyces scabiei]
MTNIPNSEALGPAKGRPTLEEIRKWPATVNVPQAAQALGCSRSQLHEMIARGDAPVRALHFDRRRVVITADLVRLLSGEGQPAA